MCGDNRLSLIGEKSPEFKAETTLERLMLR